MNHHKHDLPLPPASASCGPLGWAAMLPAWQSGLHSELQPAPMAVRAREDAQRRRLVIRGLRRATRPVVATGRLFLALLGWTVRHNLAQTGAAGRVGMPAAVAAPVPIAAPQRLDRAAPRHKAAA